MSKCDMMIMGKAGLRVNKFTTMNRFRLSHKKNLSKSHSHIMIAIARFACFSRLTTSSCSPKGTKKCQFLSASLGIKMHPVKIVSDSGPGLSLLLEYLVSSDSLRDIQASNWPSLRNATKLSASIDDAVTLDVWMGAANLRLVFAVVCYSTVQSS